MTAITGSARISCYMVAAACLLGVLFLSLSERIRRDRTGPMHLFNIFCYSAFFTVLDCLANLLMDSQPAPWCRTAALITRTLREYGILISVVLWFAFVHAKLYGTRKWRASSCRWILLPVILFAVLLAVNPFTGIVFTLSEQNRMVPTVLYYMLFLTCILIFVFPVVMILTYNRSENKRRFINPWPVIVFAALGALPQFLFAYEAWPLGFWIGITLFYFSMIDEIRFTDEESGLYNRGYLACLFELSIAGRNDVNGALILELEGETAPSFAILNSILLPEGDVIRSEDRTCFMFSRTKSRAAMQYYVSQVYEESDNWNREHPDEKIRITARCRMRPDEQSSFEFLRSVARGDEIGDEMRGMASMMTELNRLDEELRLAAEIQASMLPAVFPAFPDRTEFDLCASMTPARKVGGDFYDFFLVDNDHLALAIADVSGKGIPAALFMMVARTMIRSQTMTGCGPAEALHRVNLQLNERNLAEMFVTVWLAVLEISTGTLTAANAGHEYPVLGHAGKNFALVHDRHGFVLGALPGSKYTEYTIRLHPGDSLFVYTDGVPEASGSGNERFGSARMLEALNKRPDASPEEILSQVRRDVSRFVQGEEQFDDMTMLCLKYLHKSTEAAPAEGAAEGA